MSMEATLSAKDKPKRIACLGRAFNVGMLYDYRRDDIVPGRRLWNKEKTKSCTSVQRHADEKFEVIADDNFKDKSSHLDIDASLKLSILAGMINVSGSAGFLLDKKQSELQSRVSMKYSVKTKYEEVDLGALGDVQHPSVFEENIATHVVSAVEYGAECFFVFDSFADELKDVKKLNGLMKAAIKAIPDIPLGVDGEADIKFGDQMTEQVKHFKCTYHGDLMLENTKMPTTFKEAVEVFKKIHEFLGEKKENVVSKNVWLYPLSLLNTKASRLVREISTNCVNKAEAITMNLYSVEVRCSDLKRMDTFGYFRGLEKELTEFCSLVHNYSTNFAQQLATILPLVRDESSDKNETALLDLFKQCSESPFNSEKLNLWLNAREGEIKVLSKYLEDMKSTGVEFAFSPGALDTVVLNRKNKHVLCFAFTIARGESAYLPEMSSYLQPEKTTSRLDADPSTSWLEDPALKSDLLCHVRQFIEFAEENLTSTKLSTKFVVADRSAKACTVGDEWSLILLFKDGKETRFDPPSKPDKPTPSCPTHCSVKLEWAKPAGSVQSYTVAYSTSKALPIEQWKSVPSVLEQLTIEGLAPGVDHHFKVRAECEAGIGAFSEASDPIKTKEGKARRIAESLSDSIDCPMEEGPPLVYRLPMQQLETEEESVRKFQLGRPSHHVDTPVVSVLVVGADSNDTTIFLNAVANYLVEVSREDKFRFKLLTDELQQESKTIHSYTFHVKHSILPFTLVITVAPCFGNLSDLEADRVVTDQLSSYLSHADQSEGTHSLWLVTRAKPPGIQNQQRATFDRILSLFGKDFSANTLIMVTGADARKPPVLSALEQGIYARAFKFDFSFFFDPLDSTKEIVGDDYSKSSWQMCMESFKDTFMRIQSSSPVSFSQSINVIRSREELKAKISSLLDIVEDCQYNYGNLINTEKTLKTRIDEIESGRNREEALRGKKHLESIVLNLKKGLKDKTEEAIKLAEGIVATKKSIAETALIQSSVFTDERFVDDLIQSERTQAKPGYESRVKRYSQMSNQARVLRALEMGVDFGNTNWFEQI